MSDSNSKNMTLEQRLVQTLKDDSLMKLVGDEDAITELVTRAIREALFQPRQGFNRNEDSPVVAATRTAATTFATQAVDVIVTKMLADPVQMALVVEMVTTLLPTVILGLLRDRLDNAINVAAVEKTRELADKIRDLNQGRVIL